MLVNAFLKKLKKQLKKNLRWKRQWLQFMIIAAVVGMLSTLSIFSWLWLRERVQTAPEHAVFSRNIQQPVEAEPRQTEAEVQELVRNMKDQREGFNRTLYICGEELEPLGSMNASHIIDYHKRNPSRVVEMSPDGNVYFVNNMEDLSPRCKENAYFGMDKEGSLSLFEGVPGNSDGHVIQTFFQLNIEHLESSLPKEAVKELYRGIPVRDLSEYNSVLSTFSDFAVQTTPKSAQPFFEH